MNGGSEVAGFIIGLILAPIVGVAIGMLIIGPFAFFYSIFHLLGVL